MDSPAIQRRCLPQFGTSNVIHNVDSVEMPAQNSGTRNATLNSRMTTIDPTLAALPPQDRLRTLRSGSDIRESTSGSNLSSGNFGGKIRRLHVDLGAEANIEVGSQQSSVEGDPEHPLHNGNDTVVVPMPQTNGTVPGIRFPKIDELNHFHYGRVSLKQFKIFLDPTDPEAVAVFGEDQDSHVMFKVLVYCRGLMWFVFRDYDDFCALDQLCHRCIYNRVDSQLEPLLPDTVDTLQAVFEKNLQLRLSQYLHHLLGLGIEKINCASIMEWFEITKEGQRLHASSRSGINVRGKAAARVIRSFESSQPDELPLAVGTIVSIIDMPSADVSSWWRGKKGLKVGFFPKECVELIVKGTSPPLKHKGSRRGSSAGIGLKVKPQLPTSMSKDSLGKSDRVFGGDLGAHVYRNTDDAIDGAVDNINTCSVPLVIRKCTEFVEKHGIVEGIYRLNGVKSTIENLKWGFENATENNTPTLEVDSILADQHCVSSLCKLYFRELPNPLLTYDLFDAFCEAVTQPDPDECYMALARCLARLPPPHLRTTEHLMRHLNRLAQQSKVTEMHARNLSIVWAPNLLKIRDEVASPVNFMLIRRTAQVIEWLIERVDWFFSDHGRESMAGPIPDPSLIPTRPSVESEELEREDTPSSAQSDVAILLMPLPGEGKMMSSQSTSNLSETSERPSVRRSLSDCSRISPVTNEPSRITVVSNPRRRGSQFSLRNKNSSSSDVSRTDTVRSSGRFRSIMHLPFRKGKKPVLDISLPTNIVTTVDVKLHPRVSALPVDASGLITARETSRMLHDASSEATNSPGAASGYGTLPFAMDDVSGSLATAGSEGNDKIDEAAYAHGDSSDSETEEENEGTPDTTAMTTLSEEKSPRPESLSSTAVKRRSLAITSTSGSDSISSPRSPTRGNLQRVGSEMMALGHPGVNVRYSQHILRWTFEDGEAKAFHLSGAPAETPPDSAKSLNRRKRFGSSSCVDGSGNGAGSVMTFPSASRQSSGSVVVRQTRAEIEATAAAASATTSTASPSNGTESTAVDATGGETKATQPSPSASGDMLACVLAVGDSYVSPSRSAQDDSGDIDQPVNLASASVLVMDKESPLQSSTPVPTAMKANSRSSSSSRRSTSEDDSSGSSTSVASSRRGSPVCEDLPIGLPNTSQPSVEPDVSQPGVEPDTSQPGIPSADTDESPTKTDLALMDDVVVAVDDDTQASKITTTAEVEVVVTDTSGVRVSPRTSTASPAYSRSSSCYSGPNDDVDGDDSSTPPLESSNDGVQPASGVGDVIDETPLLNGVSDSSCSESESESSCPSSTCSSSSSSSSDECDYQRASSPGSGIDPLLVPSASTEGFTPQQSEPSSLCAANEPLLEVDIDIVDSTPVLVPLTDQNTKPAVNPDYEREAESPFDPRAEETAFSSAADADVEVVLHVPFGGEATVPETFATDRSVNQPLVDIPGSTNDFENVGTAQSVPAYVDLLGDVEISADTARASSPLISTPSSAQAEEQESAEQETWEHEPAEVERVSSPEEPRPLAFAHGMALEQLDDDNTETADAVFTPPGQRLSSTSSSVAAPSAFGHTSALQSFSSNTSDVQPGATVGSRTSSTGGAPSQTVDLNTGVYRSLSSSASVTEAQVAVASPDICEEDAAL